MKFQLFDFYVGPNTHIQFFFPGIIFKNGTVDRENSSTVQLQVTATDDGVPTRNTTTTVHITVIDFNDNTPVFFANSTNQIKDISESIENGTEVLTLEAYDLDDGPNAKITFSIESGGEGHFVIDTRVTKLVYSSNDTGPCSVIEG